MFTKFKDFFKEKTPEILKKYSQEELDEKMYDSIDSGDYDTFVDMIKKGANVNKIKTDGKEYTPLSRCVTHKTEVSEKERVKFIKYLINSGAEVFEQKFGTGESYIDFFILITLMFNKENSDEVKDCILKNHSDFIEQRDMRKNSNKYNL